MIVNQVDAKLLLEAFSCWADSDKEDWDDEGKHKDAETQAMIEKLTLATEGKLFTTDHLDATSWWDEENHRTLMFFFEDSVTLRIDLCDESPDDEHSTCELLTSAQLNMTSGELT